MNELQIEKLRELSKTDPEIAKTFKDILPPIEPMEDPQEKQPEKGFSALEKLIEFNKKRFSI